MTTSGGALYARISMDRTGAGLGVERQLDDCRELAARLGIPVRAVHSDNDMSAYTGKPRPGYGRLLDDVRSGLIDSVIVWHPDRLHRSPAELEGYIDVCDPRGVPTHTVRAGELDLSTSNGRMIARITGAVARHESEQKAERLRRQRQQAQADGRWLGGRRPFGFEPDGVTARPAEAEAIADATRRILAGDSLRTICREWNDAELLSATGKRWNASSLGQMLTRPRNAGLVGNRHGRIVGDASWHAVVDRDLWDDLVAKLADPARKTHRGVSRKLIGSGLYVCAQCGSRMRSGGQTARGGDRYACTNVEPCTRRAAEKIDEFVRDVIVGVLRRDGVDLLPEPIDLTPLRHRLKALTARADELAAEWATLGMSASQFRAANDRINGEIQDLKYDIENSSPNSVLRGVADAPDPGAAFLAADTDRQRAILDTLAVVKIVPVGAGRRGFDPSTVRVIPRGKP